MCGVKELVRLRRVLTTAGLVAATVVVAGAASSRAEFVVTNTSDSGPGSLRAALAAANANAGKDSISFAIPGSGPHTIEITSGPLPWIRDPVIVDGTSQPGFAGTPVIQVDNATGSIDMAGLAVLAGSTEVLGLAITRFGSGVSLRTGDGNRLAGNWIGVDPMGAAAGNGRNGVEIGSGSSGNVVGGTDAAARNLISGNGWSGVSLYSAGTSDNVVEGNYIGTNAAGDAALPNSNYGILIFLGASGNTVGGASSASRNLVSGNAWAGVLIHGTGSSGNRIAANYIGTDASGTHPLANGWDGVRIFGSATENTIGGASEGERNVISGNGVDGVRLAHAGTSGNFVQGNYIGTDKTGNGALANRRHGVLAYDASGNTIGGAVAGVGNEIAFNAGVGVEVAGSDASGNAILRNVISSNGDTGISLENGGNHSQAAPTITAVARSGRKTLVKGSVGGSSPATKFRIEVFVSATCDPSGAGEGSTFLKATTIETDAGGNATFSMKVKKLAPGKAVTATATSLSTNDTSQFSVCAFS